MLPLMLCYVTIDKTGEYFRLVYDVKGRFAFDRITTEEAQVRTSFQYLFCLQQLIFLLIGYSYSFTKSNVFKLGQKLSPSLPPMMAVLLAIQTHW